MSQTGPPEYRTYRFAPILLANLLPLVGVIQFGWDASLILVIYALELLILIPLALFKALFAQQSPRVDDDSQFVHGENELTQKRGSVAIVSWLPPVYPRTIGFVLDVTVFAAWIAVFIGLVLGTVVPVAEVLLRPEVLVATLGLIAGQGTEIWRDYFRGGRYKTVSPRMVLEAPARQLFFVVFILVLIPAVGITTGIVLAAFVLGKLLLEWLAFRASHGKGGMISEWFTEPTETASPVDPLPLPDGEIEARVSTDRTAVIYTGALRMVVNYVLGYTLAFGFIAFLTIAILGSDSQAVLIAIGLAIVAIYLVVMASVFAQFYLTYAPLEYRRYGDELVAYDTWLNEVQWSTPITALRNIEVVDDRVPDHRLDTRTIRATVGWGQQERKRYIGPIADHDALRAVLDDSDLQLDSGSYDRARMQGFAALTIIIIAGVALFFSPWWSSNVLFGLVALGILVMNVFDINPR